MDENPAYYQVLRYHIFVYNVVLAFERNYVDEAIVITKSCCFSFATSHYKPGFGTIESECVGFTSVNSLMCH